MASDTLRPPADNGGSRPPTSRFVEGSMNDRVSATPPPQYLGPEELKEYEKQFYTDRPVTRGEMRKPRRQRPFSESSVPETNAQDRIITHRKSTSFFERVREVLRWNSSSRSSASSQKTSSSRKHTSLQEPPLSPRMDNLRAAKSHSEIPYHNLPELPNFGSGANRPTREDVMQSYSHLMATGFFQSHAIQSTRHAAPGARDDKRRSAPPMPTIPGSAPCTPKPPRISSLELVESPKSSQSPMRAGWQEQALVGVETELEDEFIHAVKNKSSRYDSLRGRKRNRVDSEEVASPEAPGLSTSSSFAQPLKRVAKKLRKMPSAKDVEMSDAMVSLPPSVSVGGTMYLKEKSVRMREPSPTPPEVSNRRTDYQHHGHYHQPKPRRTFSGSSRGEGNRLRKRGKSASLRSRDTGFETWEMEGQRLSTDSIHQDSTAMSEAEAAAQEMARSREATPLRVVPDSNRGIPSVPRIPDQYHFYHKPNAHYDFENEIENSGWQFGEAL
ncbi:uncharacterized protein F4807DRAFT_423310 [Annulohypoxylon truncatum]|uniref:uncharacterized protein n=1 Tax=Annulohypoxylon truncatum TaxID=327061 RepID=UPI0020076231|nr:uncharacterized protein F4807DRAFT_423310 [Annulohypoxylon truncatum]KAI1210408.1 hypothetical protein F4807DRAFT_423310 [Annulohypoxylon truncatum]